MNFGRNQQPKLIRRYIELAKGGESMLCKDIRVMSGVVALGFLSACATSEGTNASTTASEDPSCHVIGKIEKWQIFDHRHVYVEGADGDSRFFLTTRSMCRAMPNARLVEIPNPQEPVCNSGSRIAFPDGERRKTCTLSRVEKVASVDEAMALFNARVHQ